MWVKHKLWFIDQKLRQLKVECESTDVTSSMSVCFSYQVFVS